MGMVASYLQGPPILSLEAEIGDNFPKPTEPTAVGYCFSGGGSRAYTCASGYLRALHRAGLLRPNDFISGVSGGSWAVTVYSFAQADPDVLLGACLQPHELSIELLASTDEQCMLHAATTQNLAAVVGKLESLGELWMDLVAANFLEPYGINGEAAFSPCQQSTAEIIERNPSLAHHAWAEPIEGRPHPVTSAVLIGPVGHDHSTCPQLLPVEITARQTGIPGGKRTVMYGQQEVAVGGFVESFAFGSQLVARSGSSSSVSCTTASPFKLKQAIGFSSAAFATIAENWGAPQAVYWSPENIANAEGFDNTTESSPAMFGDGGAVENYGLMPLLRRGVAKLVVFIDTSTPLCMEPLEPSVSEIGMDALDVYLGPLFGVRLKGMDQDYWLSHGMELRNNQVFENENGQFAKLVSSLQHKKRAGLPVTASTTLRTVPNQYWGLEQPYEVQVKWVYLERVQCWEEKLESTLQSQLQKQEDNEFRSFPHYDTLHQNSGLDVISLSAPQANLLSHLCSWVCEHGGVVDFARSASPLPVEGTSYADCLR